MGSEYRQFHGVLVSGVSPCVMGSCSLVEMMSLLACASPSLA